MGIVDSCTHEYVCCGDKKNQCCPNKKEEKNLSEDEYSSEEDPTENVEVPQNVINIKIKTNDLIMEHDMNTSPWEYYESICNMGAGTFGTVHKVCLKSNKLIHRAMKIIPKSSLIEGLDNLRIIDEIKILKTLDHPNIMKLYEFFIDDENYYIVSELCEEGDLLGKIQKIGTMNQIVVKVIMEQILNAVAYLHSKNVMHGDIKLENVLLYRASQTSGRRFTKINVDINNRTSLRKDLNLGQENYSSQDSKTILKEMLTYEIKLIDFGCSKYFVKKNKHRKLSGIIGTSIYCAPEVVNNYYDEKSDEWSCGVLMYILLSGIPPFTGYTEDEIFENVKKCNYNFYHKAFNNVSKNCKDLIKRLLEPDNNKRIKASQALKHPFFSELFNINIAIKKNTDLSLLKRLIGFKKKECKFYETIIAFITVHFINIDEEQKLRNLFRYLDTNDKNELTKLDLKKGFDEVGLNLTEKEFDEIYDTFDSDGGGYIEYQEFLRNMADTNTLLTDDNLKNVFVIIGGEGKDYITGKEIKKFIFREATMREETARDYFNQFGKTINDIMKYDEFVYFMRNIEEYLENVKKKREENLIKDMLKNEQKIENEKKEKEKLQEKDKNNEETKEDEESGEKGETTTN